MNKRQIEFEGFTGEVEIIKKKVGETTYSVNLLGGRWPVSRDLIILCDGGDPYGPEPLCQVENSVVVLDHPSVGYSQPDKAIVMVKV